jgi:hypothetical protein
MCWASFGCKPQFGRAWSGLAWSVTVMRGMASQGAEGQGLQTAARRAPALSAALTESRCGVTRLRLVGSFSAGMGGLRHGWAW